MGVLRKIRVIPLAAESFGVRSMCTLVETPDVSVLLDAGISLSPYRFNLPPHPIEFQTISRLRKAIAQAAEKAAITTISHYHFDHHTPSFEDWVVNWTEEGETARQIYQDKIVLAKNPLKNINSNQRKRGWMFNKTGGKYSKTVVAADGKTFSFGNTKIHFSEAVVHGVEESARGWVIMATVEHGEERFMFSPDVQGPMSKSTTELILATKPQMIMLGGPPLYLGGFSVDLSHLEYGLCNFESIVKTVPLVILEHHALRDEDWRSKMDRVYAKAAEKGHTIQTAAEYAVAKNNFLESKRKQLYCDQPPSEEFRAWTKTLNNKVLAKPPI